MMSTRFFVLAVLLVGVSCRYVTPDIGHPIFIIELDDTAAEQQFEPVRPEHLRMRRQIHGAGSTNPDGSYNIMAKLPLAGNDKNVLSAIGSVNAFDKNKGTYGAAGGGLALDNVNGHGLSVTKTHIPTFGDQLTAAGKVNVLHTPNHDMNVNAYATRNMPKFPGVPNYNTVGGSLDYMYKNKVGGSLGMAHTDLFKKTDYSAMGNVNLFKNPTTSLDMNAGFSRSVSPFIPKSSWQPSAGLTFTKYW